MKKAFFTFAIVLFGGTGTNSIQGTQRWADQPAKRFHFVWDSNPNKWRHVHRT